MKNTIRQWWDSIPAKGGLLGALFGALASSRYHRPEDKPLRNAGKTAIFTGFGFLLGHWIEIMLKKKK
jgi:uncharacterized membrane protein YccC